MKNMGKLVAILGVFALIAAVIATNVADAKTKAKRAGYLGVTTQAVDPDMAEAFKLNVQHGAIVNTVYDDSPAEKAGIQEDDVIIAVNGKKITDDDDLTDEIRSFDEGEEVTITLIRDAKQMEVKTTLAARNTTRTFVRNPRNRADDDESDDDEGYAFGFDSDRRQGYIGVSLVTLTDQLATYFGVQEGVLISEVEDDSPAQKAGLKAGDVVTKIDGSDVDDASDLSRVIQRKDEGEKVQVTFNRKGSSQVLQVTVDERRASSLWGFNFAPDAPGAPAPPMIPHMRGLHRTPGPDVWYFDSDDNRRDRKSLQREMERLQREMRQLEQELDEVARSKEDRARQEQDESR